MESRAGESGVAGAADGGQETRDRREMEAASSRRSADSSRKGGDSNSDDEATDARTRPSSEGDGGF